MIDAKNPISIIAKAFSDSEKSTLANQMAPRSHRIVASARQILGTNIPQQPQMGGQMGVMQGFPGRPTPQAQAQPQANPFGAMAGPGPGAGGFSSISPSPTSIASGPNIQQAPQGGQLPGYASGGRVDLGKIMSAVFGRDPNNVYSALMGGNFSDGVDTAGIQSYFERLGGGNPSDLITQAFRGRIDDGGAVPNSFGDSGAKLELLSRILGANEVSTGSGSPNPVDFGGATTDAYGRNLADIPEGERTVVANRGNPFTYGFGPEWNHMFTGGQDAKNFQVQNRNPQVDEGYFYGYKPYSFLQGYAEGGRVIDKNPLPLLDKYRETLRKLDEQSIVSIPQEYLDYMDSLSWIHDPNTYKDLGEEKRGYWPYDLESSYGDFMPVVRKMLKEGPLPPEVAKVYYNALQYKNNKEAKYPIRKDKGYAEGGRVQDFMQDYTPDSMRIDPQDPGALLDAAIMGAEQRGDKMEAQRLRQIQQIMMQNLDNPQMGQMGAQIPKGFACGGRVNYASGGHVTGPGGPKSDSILARLSNNEYVLPAEITHILGDGNPKEGGEILDMAVQILKRGA